MILLVFSQFILVSFGYFEEKDSDFKFYFLNVIVVFKEYLSYFFEEVKERIIK